MLKSLILKRFFILYIKYLIIIEIIRFFTLVFIWTENTVSFKLFIVFICEPFPPGAVILIKAVFRCSDAALRDSVTWHFKNQRSDISRNIDDTTKMKTLLYSNIDIADHICYECLVSSMTNWSLLAAQVLFLRPPISRVIFTWIVYR